MSMQSLTSKLNEPQRTAATMPDQDILVLAGVGCGKTTVIVARAANLISTGTPPDKIVILAFTRSAAAEIVERVRAHLGDAASGLRASTFHSWCMSLIKRAPSAFGCDDYTVIDRDDQLNLIRAQRGRTASPLPTAETILDLYSYARNALQTLDATLMKNAPDDHWQKDQIAEIMLGYEEKKEELRFLDYDDILDVVAQGMASSPETLAWVAGEIEHLLVDEFQDTNPLQWKLLDQLKHKVTLFCVGDDAQSIYGFRGADFQNVHSFAERVEGAAILKLTENYRSTQEILDASNWLLAASPLSYGKKLVAARGTGISPQLHTFDSEWAEGAWITDDLLARRCEGADWRDHMILVRSAAAARVIESMLVAKDIPYRFIGGAKLMEGAHIRDVLSALRVVANKHDEIAWIRFLTLWSGVGDVTATRIIKKISSEQTLDGCLDILKSESKIPAAAIETLEGIRGFQCEVAKAFTCAVSGMEKILSEKYRHQEWEKRKNDFQLVEKLAEKHSSFLEFIEAYLLDPVHGSQVKRLETEDAVTVITIHSAKGTEAKVCYVVNVTPGAYPSSYSQGDEDEVEEERRVLYVALTRARDELIVTRHGYRLWATPGNMKDDTAIETYFLNSLPKGLFEEHAHQQGSWSPTPYVAKSIKPISVGITIG